MKFVITLTLIVLASFAAIAEKLALESIEVTSNQVGVSIENNDKDLVLTFDNHTLSGTHSIIQIGRLNDLKYKTRVMRYFGGLLVNNTFTFKKLVVVVNGDRMEYDWSRTNVSTVVKKMCLQAEMMI